MSLRFSSAFAASLLTLAPILALCAAGPVRTLAERGAAPTLDVSTGSGDVTVRAGAGGAIVVKGKVSVNKGSNAPANAAEIAKQVAANPPIEQTGDAVRVGRISRRDDPQGRVDLVRESACPLLRAWWSAPGRATWR